MLQVKGRVQLSGKCLLSLCMQCPRFGPYHRKKTEAIGMQIEREGEGKPGKRRRNEFRYSVLGKCVIISDDYSLNI